jgi:predicted HTH domain antitoxin
MRLISLAKRESVRHEHRSQRDEEISVVAARLKSGISCGMVITLNISESVARHFGDTPDAIGRNLLLKAALEDYREARISEGRFAEILGVSRWEAQEILDQHNARRPYTVAMLEEDRCDLDKAVGNQ